MVTRIDALDGMMKDLLLFARPPRPRCVPTDVVLLVASTAASLARDPALNGIDIAVEGSAPRRGRRRRNAADRAAQPAGQRRAQAMKGRGRIDVAVAVQDTCCRISVADNGPGIPAEIRDKIFTPFFTTKSQGSGLGLPTAKRLVEAHAGSIAIDCPATGGTTVVLQLPTQPLN